MILARILDELSCGYVQICNRVLESPKIQIMCKKEVSGSKLSHGQASTDRQMEGQMNG